MKKPTREDERKLYEAYAVLDNLLNDHNLINDLCKDKINKIFDELSSKLAHIVSIVYNARLDYREQTTMDMKFEKWLEEEREKFLK